MDGFAEGLRRHGSSPEAAEDPQILATQRACEKWDWLQAAPRKHGEFGGPRRACPIFSRARIEQVVKQVQKTIARLEGDIWRR
jgi:hypothetical protein